MVVMYQYENEQPVQVLHIKVNIDRHMPKSKSGKRYKKT